MVVTLVLFTGLSACRPAPVEEAAPSEEVTPEKAAPEEEVKLVYYNWTAAEIPGEDELVRRFEADNPGIKIELVTGPYEPHHDKIISMTQAKNPPDVFQLIPEYLVTFAVNDVVAPLDEFVAQQGGEGFLDQYLDAGIAMSRWNGKLYALPWRFGCSAMYINTKRFQDAGVEIPNGETWTWDEMLKVAKELTDPAKKQYGFGYSGAKDNRGTSWEWFGFLFQNGGQMIQDGKAAFNSPAGVEAFEWWVSLYRDHKVTPEGTPALGDKDLADMLGRGDVAMWQNGPWWIVLLQKGYPDLEFTTILLPNRVQDGSSAGGTLLAISPQSKHKTEAWKFISYMTSESTLREWSKRGNFMPPNKAVLKDPMFQEPPMKAFTQQALLPHTYTIGSIPESAALFDILQSYMQMAFLGEMAPKEALDQAAQEWDAILAEYY